MTWQHHRTKNPRNCDQCPPRNPAAWNLHAPGVLPMYLCDRHARRLAGIYDIEPPPVTGGGIPATRGSLPR